MPQLDPRTTALVLIDLQNAVVGRPLAPHSAENVVIACKALAERFRRAGAPVVLVRVSFADDFADAPSQAVDSPMSIPPGGFPKGWDRLVEGLEQPSDIIVVKRRWGAFHGTDLDTHLRRRGVATIVLGGIATNFGVESTAREAWQHGYDVVAVEDAMTSTEDHMHTFAIKDIFPRIARMTQAFDVELLAA